MSNGVVTLNEEGRIVTCNNAGLRILRVAAKEILNRLAGEFFTGGNAWILGAHRGSGNTLQPDIAMDAELTSPPTGFRSTSRCCR